MHRPSSFPPPVAGKGGHEGDGPERPSGVMKTVPAVPQTMAGYKEAPLMAKVVDAFLVGFEKLTREQRTAKLDGIKKSIQSFIPRSRDG